MTSNRMKTLEYRLGVDVGGTNLVAAVVDGSFRILSKVSIPAGAHRGIDEITGDIVRVSRMAVEEAGIPMEKVSSWGIGMPSCINPTTGLLVHANCFGWKNVPIFHYLEGKLPLPLKIENDANCAALGEALAGAAKGRSNVLMLTLGTGVGSGIVIDGKLFTGADGMGAELGHTKLVYDGRPCTCGQKGCLEAYCSATALIRTAREAVGDHPESEILALAGGNAGKINGKTVFEAAAKGDSLAGSILDDYVSHLAAGLSSFITIFRPEAIILGGGIALAGDALFGRLAAKLPKLTFGAAQIGVPPVLPATLGNDAGLIGAAFL